MCGSGWGERGGEGRVCVRAGVMKKGKDDKERFKIKVAMREGRRGGMAVVCE